MKSLYNLKKLLQRQLMGCFYQICSMYSVIIKVFNHIASVFFIYPVDGRGSVQLNPQIMATPQEKAQCVSWFIETKSDMQTQRNYRINYRRHPPSRPSIRAWHNKFMETGTVLDKERSGRPKISEENINRVREASARSPTKSIRTAARQFSYSYHVQQCTKSYTRICDCTLTKCNSYRHLNQMINQDEKSLQLTC